MKKCPWMENRLVMKKNKEIHGWTLRMYANWSESEKDKYHMISFIYGIWKKKFKLIETTVDWRLWGIRWMGEGGQRIQTSSYKMNKFCRGSCVISLILSHHSKDLKQRSSVTARLKLRILFSKQRKIHSWGMRVGWPQKRGPILAPLFICFMSSPWACSI